MKRHRLAWCLLLNFGLLSAAPVAASADVLLFDDGSAGSAWEAPALLQFYVDNGQTVTRPTCWDDFTAALTTGTWTEVVVLAEYAAASEHEAVLLTFAHENPHAHVWASLWNADACEFPPNAAIGASALELLWTRHRTFYSYYMCDAAADANPARTRMVAVLVLPTFDGVRVHAPIVLDSADRAASPCDTTCTTRLMTDLQRCLDDWQGDMTQCNLLYPDPDTDPQWDACMDDADQAHNDCRKAARKRYLRCRALCFRHVAAAPE